MRRFTPNRKGDSPQEGGRDKQQMEDKQRRKEENLVEGGVGIITTVPVAFLQKLASASPPMGSRH